MVKLTGPRAEQAAYLQDIRRQRYITAEQYRVEKAKLERQQVGVNKRAAAAAARRAEKEKEREAAAAKKEAAAAKKILEKAAAVAARKAERAAARAIARDRRRVRAVATGDNIHDDAGLNALWKQVRDQEVRFVVVDRSTGTASHDDVMVVPSPYKEFRRIFLVQVLGEAYDADIADTVLPNSRLVVLRPVALTGQRIAQMFRDGDVHCVFSVIISELEKRMEDSSSPATAKRYAQRIAKQRELEQQFAAGVPEAEMETVARAAGFKIELVDALGQAMAVYNANGRVGTIQFSNTRLNHVERGMVVRSNPTEIYEEQLWAKWNDLKEAKKHYEIQGDLKNRRIRRLNTMDGSFVAPDPEQKIYQQFDEEIKLDMFRVNANVNPELNAFLHEGQIINSWSTDLGHRGMETACADLSRAYSRFKDAPRYAGFLGKVQQFRSGSFSLDFIAKNIGFYRVTVTNEPSELLKRLGLDYDLTLVMFSQEILFYADLGVEFTADMGAWGSKMEFEFPDYMLENRRYCIWSGRLGMDRTHTRLTIPAESAFADILKSNGHEVLFWKEDGLATIKQPNKHRWTAHHILGAITAYTRMNMVTAMLKFKPEQLCRVVMDGIYYRGEMPDLPNFTKKPVKRAMSNCPWFTHATRDFIAEPMPMTPIVRTTVLTGQGGSGKTFSILTDKGYIQPLVVVPCNQLGMDHREKYGVPFTTIHKLVGIECRPYHEERGHPPVCLIDELTQIPGDWIDKAREMYPHTLFIVAGDVDAAGRWYQCRGGDGAEYTPLWKPTQCDFIDFTADRRSRDEELKALKLRTREQMRAVFGEDQDMLMKAWAIANMPQESEIDFQPGDTVIAGTHRTNKKLLEKGIVSGYYKSGGYVSFEEKAGYEKRGSFTIHSYQGKTIENGRIWIVLDDLFEYAMFYTAISRAVNFSQLKFIRRV